MWAKDSRATFVERSPKDRRLSCRKLCWVPLEIKARLVHDFFSLKLTALSGNHEEQVFVLIENTGVQTSGAPWLCICTFICICTLLRIQNLVISISKQLFTKRVCVCVCVCVLVAQSCLTLCSPMDYSLLGSSVHEISQAVILEWVASHVRLFATPWTIAHQAPLSMRFPRREYWSGLPFPSPEDPPNPGIKPGSPASPPLAGKFFTSSTTWEALFNK